MLVEKRDITICRAGEHFQCLHPGGERSNRLLRPVVPSSGTHLRGPFLPFGIKVTIVEPGAYANEFGSPSSSKFAAGLEIYADLKAHVFEGMKSMERGDPKATPDAMFKLVDAENPPPRLFLGSHNLPSVRAAYADRLATWEARKSVADSAQGSSKG